MLLGKGKKQLPVEDYLPDGFIKDIGGSYLEGLPDVENNPLSLESFFHSDESSWVDYIVAYFLLYPYFVLIVAVFGAVAFFLWKKIKTRQEILKMEPCKICGHFIFLCAPCCQYCKSPHAGMGDVGVSGFSKRRVPPDYLDLKLKRYKRCRFCGCYMLKSKLRQKCEACGTECFSQIDDILIYDRYLQKNRGFIYILVTVLSFVPIVGPLLACHVYRRCLIAPYIAYMSFKQGNLLIGSLTFARFLFRYIPLIGILGIPVLSVVENKVFRNFFIKNAKDTFLNGFEKS